MMEFSISIHVDDETQISDEVGPNHVKEDKKQKKKSVPPVKKSKFGRTKKDRNKKSTPASNPVAPPKTSTAPGLDAAITPPGINTNGMTTAQLKRKVRDDHRTKAQANDRIANLDLQLAEMERTLQDKDEKIRTICREKQDDKKAVNNVSKLLF